MNGNHLDRKRTQIIKGKKVTFTLLDPVSYIPPLEKVTSVAVVPFDQDGNIVTALLKRGPDLPGGHMQVGEKDFSETARREALEEAFITLGKIEIACVIQSDYYGDTDDKLTYMIVMAGMIDKLEAEKPNKESAGRKVMSIEKFLQDYSAGDKNFMRDIVMQAQKTYQRMIPENLTEEVLAAVEATRNDVLSKE